MADGRGGEYADSFSGEAAAVTGTGDPLRRRVIAQFDRCAGKYVDAERRDALLAGMTFYDGSSEEALDGLLRGRSTSSARPAERRSWARCWPGR